MEIITAGAVVMAGVLLITVSRWKSVTGRLGFNKFYVMPVPLTVNLL